MNMKNSNMEKELKHVKVLIYFKCIIIKVTAYKNNNYLKDKFFIFSCTIYTYYYYDMAIFGHIVFT